RIAGFTTSIGNFRGAVRKWSELAVKDRAATLNWTVIPASDHLERLLPPASLDMPWYRSLWINVREALRGDRPPLDVTSKPVLVRDIWGQYERQKKSWLMSVAFQSTVVLLLFGLASTKVEPQQVRNLITLLNPNIVAYEPKP